MPPSGHAYFPSAAIVILWLIAITSPAHAADSLCTVALTGTPVPGASPDARFTGFENRVNPAINNNGHTAFQAFFSESEINYAAVLTEGGGSGLRVAARQEVPITAGAPFLHVLQGLNDQGQTAYHAKVPPDLTAGLPLDLIRDNGPGDSEVVARWATAEETGFGFTELFPFSIPLSGNGASLADAGQVVFSARASDSGLAGNRYVGIWREDAGGELSGIVRVGDPAPGTPNAFQSFGEPPFIVTNRAGRVAFIARTNNAGPNLGVWSERNSGLHLEARVGAAAPGVDAANFTTFIAARGFGFNSAGQLSFAAEVQGTAINGNNNSGLWCNCGDGLELIAREGDQALGATPGQTYADFHAQVLNARGDLAFVAATRGPNGSNIFGLWSDAGGIGLKQLAYPGISAPGTGPGTVFNALSVSFLGSTMSTPLALNANGQAAFMSSIAGPGVDESNNSGIWAEDRLGSLRLIARRGDQLNVSDDPLHPDWRTISGLLVSGSSGNDDGRRSWFNDHGQLAFLATFTDGTRGLFVSDLATVPEPNSLTLLLLLPFFRCPRTKTSTAHSDLGFPAFLGALCTLASWRALR